MTRRRVGARAALAFALLAIASARPARAWIPEPERAWSLVAQSNASRTHPLAIDVALVGADGAVVATGTVRMDPGGRAKMGLTYADGTVEMHERTPNDYKVTRGGAAVAKPVRLLPPNALLQAASALAVSDALRGIGGDPALVDLGIEGAHDCWVLGGRDMGPFDSNSRASLWMDQESLQPARIDDGAGTQYRFGAPASRQGIRFPAWIEVRTVGQNGWRIDVKNVTPAP